MIKYLADCCLEVIFDAEPDLILETGDTDPFTGEEISWPNPRVYWSNGAITDGTWTTDGATEAT